jgi:phage portal protein BeeE
VDREPEALPVEIAMYFGVPPHMLGDTEKSTSWGTGIEQQTQGFVTSRPKKTSRCGKRESQST